MIFAIENIRVLAPGRPKLWLCRLLFVLLLILVPRGLAAAETTPTFTRDILPILQQRCQTCHRPDQVAPMSFLTYEEVRPWVKSIRKVVHERTMPPFHAAGPLGRYRDDPRLTDAQIETILDWAERGAPRGNPQDAPLAVDWNAPAGAVAEPDLVLKFGGYTTNPQNADAYVAFISEHVFPEDTWLESIEIKPADMSLVHHAALYAVPKSMAVLEPALETGFLATKSSIPALMKNHLLTWLPGQGPRERKGGQGFLIEAGSRLVIDAHISPTEETTPVAIALRMRYVEGILDRETKNKPFRVTDIDIPAHESRYVRSGFRKFGREVTIFGFNVHMHLRGKSSRFVLHLPNGRSGTVFEIPKWDFNWQREYYLTTPIVVPRGTRVEYIAEWDNSAANPFNPDPSRRVEFGAQTEDEMYGGRVLYHYPREESLVVRAGRQVEVIDVQAPATDED